MTLPKPTRPAPPMPAVKPPAVDYRAQFERAERALLRAGFTDNGGQEWKPPIGRAPDFFFRDLLVGYMAEVLYQEGITYVEHPDVLTEEDAALLRELTADAVAYLAREEKKWQ